MADIYREKVIKVRVTDEEYVALKQRSAKPRLAEWMRETCLDTNGQRKSRSQPRSSADPALLRQLAGIGNNLNQIARRVNSGQWGPLERVHV
ncbi:MobC family plasmid mobilization relaxosome protein, partial [Vreelandella alkaliphila]